MEENGPGSKAGRNLEGRAWGRLVCTETFAALRLRGQEAALGVDDKGSELVVDVKASDVRLKIKQVSLAFLPSNPSVAPSQPLPLSLPAADGVDSTVASRVATLHNDQEQRRTKVLRGISKTTKT
jgi:hypothetical protein